MFDKSVRGKVLFGPCLQKEKSNFMYENEVIPKNSTVIWVPDEHKTVSLVSYERAHQENDTKLLDKLVSIGIPLNCTFGGCISLTK